MQTRKMAKELPGFHFDEEKHKYFRIQPEYVAPKGYRYTKAAVNAEKEASLVCCPTFRCYGTSLKTSWIFSSIGKGY